jgi:hypothetical protein
MRFAGNFHPEWGYLAPAPNFMRTVRIVAVATAIGATAGAAVVLSLADHPAANPVTDAGKSLVVVHSLVQPAEAAAPATTPAPAPTAALAAPPVVAQPAPTTTSASPPPQHVQASAQPIAPTPPALARQPAPLASDSSTMATSQPPASVAALSESPPATEVARASDVAIVAPVPAAPLAPVAPAAEPKDTAIKPPVSAPVHDVQQHGPQPIATAPPAPAPAPKKKITTNENGLGPILRHLFSAQN